MGRPKPIAAADCETDPFKARRVPKPFLWGITEDGITVRKFRTTEEFVDYVKDKKIIIYAHNGGKFDFIFLMPFILKVLPPGSTVKAQIINGRIVHMKLGEADLLDSYAAVPESLKRIKKRSIEIWKLEENVRAKYMHEIEHYMEGDCLYLYELMTTYRKAAGTRRTIASNALQHSKKLGVDLGKTNHRYDANYRPYYFGGRTQCFQPGTHKNVRVLDIKSSYPYAMMHDHPCGNSDDMHRRNSLEGLTREEIQRSFITIDGFCDGAFPTRGLTNDGLNFPSAYSLQACKEGVWRVTGWEYLAAHELGLLREAQILEVRFCEKTINFSPYVLHWYGYKNDHPKKEFPIEYTIGKIMMNSLYGKASENPEKYFDYTIKPIGSKLSCRQAIVGSDGQPEGRRTRDHGYSNKFCKVCGFHENDHGWKLYTTFEGLEFHRREALWKYKQRYNVEWESKPLYKNVATGASITGFARAYLLRAIHKIGRGHIIYCDTDSLIVDETADISCLTIGKEIGDWDLEIAGAPLALFAGKKQYGIDKTGRGECHCGHPDKDCERHKVVTKGARMTFRDMEKLIAGETIHYESDAPTFSIARGVTFVQRNIVGTGIKNRA